MLSVQRLSRIGSWSLILVGAGHLLTDLLAPADASQEEGVRRMKEVIVALPGSHRTLWDYHHGFSLTMGLLLIGYGAVTLAMERIEAGNASKLAPVLGISSLVCLAALGLSATHFFAVPVLFTAVASASFALGWRRSKIARPGAPPLPNSPRVLEDG
jgi:hypothetical protein